LKGKKFTDKRNNKHKTIIGELNHYEQEFVEKNINNKTVQNGGSVHCGDAADHQTMLSTYNLKIKRAKFSQV